MTNSNPGGSVLGLDVGDRRIGVAVASLAARLPRPLTTLDNTDDALPAIARLVQEHDAVEVVMGLPRNLQGQDTPQTGSTRAFAARLEALLPVPVYLRDEALTSRQAEAVLRSRKARYTKADIDALAAVLILDDYMSSKQGKENV